MTNKTVSLVLGSGGARGLAHIGVIHWLEDNGYDIHSISGCSMGALIGGILNPVPIAPTFEDNTDLTIAINLGAPPSGNLQPKLNIELTDANDSPSDNVSAKIRNFIEDLKNRTPTNSVGSWKLLSLADQTFNAMQGAIARQKLAAYPPDHTIMIARNACGTLEFDRADEMIALGYESASRCLDKS